MTIINKSSEYIPLRFLKFELSTLKIPCNASLNEKESME